MAAHTYTHPDLLAQAAKLRQALARDHVAEMPTTHKRGTVFAHNPLYPFQLLVHDLGATLVVNVRCGKCREHLARTEAL